MGDWLDSKFSIKNFVIFKPTEYSFNGNMENSVDAKLLFLVHLKDDKPVVGT